MTINDWMTTKMNKPEVVLIIGLFKIAFYQTLRLQFTCLRRQATKLSLMYSNPLWKDNNVLASVYFSLEIYVLDFM